MPTFETQIWKSARLTIERGKSETQGTIFRFYGPFTGRDMYNSLSPDAFRNIFESAPDHEQPAAHLFDLTEVPYMDSAGLGMIVSHYVRCQGRGVRLVAVGVSSRVVQLFELTKVDKFFPRFDSVEEAGRA